MNLAYIAMWVVTIAALFLISRYNPLYAVILALVLAFLYAIKYLRNKKNKGL